MLKTHFHFLMPGHFTYQDIAFSVCPIYNEASTNGLKVVFDNLGQEWNVKTDVFGLQLDIHMYLRLTLPRPCKAGTGSLGGAHNYIYVNSLYGHTSGSYGPGSNSAVLELVAGDTVFRHQAPRLVLVWGRGWGLQHVLGLFVVTYWQPPPVVG